jgi:hypothetical protein
VQCSAAIHCSCPSTSPSAPSSHGAMRTGRSFWSRRMRRCPRPVELRPAGAAAVRARRGVGGLHHRHEWVTDAQLINAKDDHVRAPVPAPFSGLGGPAALIRPNDQHFSPDARALPAARALVVRYREVADRVLARRSPCPPVLINVPSLSTPLAGSQPSITGRFSPSTEGETSRHAGGRSCTGLQIPQPLERWVGPPGTQMCRLRLDSPPPPRDCRCTPWPTARRTGASPGTIRLRCAHVPVSC